jgi:hypothetical protein
MELREQRRLDAGASLVVHPKPIAKRLDHVVRGDAEVRVAILDHLEDGLQHADDGAVGAVHAFVEPAQAVEVTEKLIGPVDKVNDHFGVTLDYMASRASAKQRLGEVRVLFTLQNAPLTPSEHPARLRRIPALRIGQDCRQHGRLLPRQTARALTPK